MKHLASRFPSLFTLFILVSLMGCTVSLDQTQPPALTEAVAEQSPNPDRQIPVTWENLKLTGRLVFIHINPSDFSIAPRIQALDLGTGKISTLFESGSGGWIYYLSASPDGKQLVISYVPPSTGNAKVSQALYTIPVDGSSAPRILVSPPTPGDQYIQAEWSPDGKYIYYVHVNQQQPLKPGQLLPIYTLSRISIPEGVQEQIADNAFWPRLSVDASRMVYISSDPFSAKNQLYIANADGSDARDVGISGSWKPDIKDAPLLSPDNQTIIFSAPISPAAYQPNWLDRLMGVMSVQAHSVPSDWWAISSNGGVLTRLTKIQTVNLFASLAPDKAHIASLSGDGIFVMKLDGSGLTQILLDKGVFGALTWIP